ncbi:MAG: DinB family protein [Gemmatimonadaceae bacterium]|nr:DinB family protein [Gemmatimonadaceae bacterium]
MSVLLLQPTPGASPQIGALLAMLEATRASTLAAVAGLSTAALAHRHDATANPIGALIAHITAIEYAYLTATLETTPPSMDEWTVHGPLIRLGPAAWAAAEGRSLDDLLGVMAAVRARTVAALSQRADAWLTTTLTLPWLSGPATPFWAWYHVMEDELNHRGQIRLLRARLPEALRA